MNWPDKLQALKRNIAKKERILIAFSREVDCSLLAKIARDELGDNALCVILDSETLSRNELKYAEELSRSLNLNCEATRYSLLTMRSFEILLRGVTSARKPPQKCLRILPRREGSLS